jgi:hypothetical protein
VRVERLFPNSTVVCLASGPSLTREDVASCRGQARVIAVNDTHRWAPWADALYACDAKWWMYHQGVPSFTGLKYALAPTRRDVRTSETFAPGVQVLRNTGPDGLELDPTGLRHGRNSGYQAVGLAVHLGASRIVLLGYDLHAPDGGKSHFFGDHPDELRKTSPYGEFRRAFGTLVGPLRELGITVINASRRTALTAFPRMALADALAPAEVLA